MEPIRSHDALFRFVFGEPEQIADLLRSCLPPELVAAIRWPTLRRLPDAFVDKALGERRSDVLYIVEIGDSVALVHLLNEHKSWVDRFTALQQAGYTVRLLEAWRAEHPAARTVPAVLSFVLYHGDEPWLAPTSPHELVDTTGWDAATLELLLPRQLRLPFFLLDLSQFDEARLDALRTSAVVGLTLRFLQFLRHLGVLAAIDPIRRWQHLIAAVLEHPRGHDFLVALCSWLLGKEPADHDT
ncbi:MAG: Rpn family recombination-promoting nuclease/putative transposase, partial [Planctomycetes bacterium]|nr:Rpn family recombination-promoting nuclease/putative transposase [Planctomycetota bacterium]